MIEFKNGDMTVPLKSQRKFRMVMDAMSDRHMGTALGAAGGPGLVFEQLHRVLQGAVPSSWMQFGEAVRAACARREGDVAL